MDLQNYENEEILRDQFPQHLPISEEISLLEWKDKYYLPPDSYYIRHKDYNV
jgi:hypothetical protein